MNVEASFVSRGSSGKRRVVHVIIDRVEEGKIVGVCSNRACLPGSLCLYQDRSQQ